MTQEFRSLCMAARRLFLIDDNVRLVSGHFFELMSLMAEAGSAGGYEVHAAVHESFDDLDQVHSKVTVHPIFQTRRLVRWSLGVDGDSRLPRNLDGSPIGSSIRRWRSNAADSMNFPSKRPCHTLELWRSGFAGWLRSMSASTDDRIVLSTSDDFCLLALAGVLRDYQGDPLHISALMHFALVDRQTKRPGRVLGHVGKQLRDAYSTIRNDNKISLYATTQSLTEQYRATESGFPVQSVDYPTRYTTPIIKRPSGPIRCVLAGLPRAEKGRGWIPDYLVSIEGLLDTGEFVVAAQMPADQWQLMVPKNMHDRVTVNQPGANSENQFASIEIRTGGLGVHQYHEWLDLADVGIFLYDPDRYEARASGVLLELMVRGVPVIVPDRCHMAQEVHRYGGDGVCGWVYQHRDEVPSIMTEFANNRDRVVASCRQVAQRVAVNHDAAKLLARMNLLERRHKRAA